MKKRNYWLGALVLAILFAMALPIIPPLAVLPVEAASTNTAPGSIGSTNKTNPFDEPAAKWATAKPTQQTASPYGLTYTSTAMPTSFEYSDYLEYGVYDGRQQKYGDVTVALYGGVTNGNEKITLYATRGNSSTNVENPIYIRLKAKVDVTITFSLQATAGYKAGYHTYANRFADGANGGQIMPEQGTVNPSATATKKTWGYQYTLSTATNYNAFNSLTNQTLELKAGQSLIVGLSSTQRGFLADLSLTIHDVAGPAGNHVVKATSTLATFGEVNITANDSSAKIDKTKVNSCDTVTATVPEGTEVTLTANGVGYYAFTGWYKEGTDTLVSTANPYIITPTESLLLEARFEDAVQISFEGVGTTTRFGTLDVYKNGKLLLSLPGSDNVASRTEKIGVSTELTVKAKPIEGYAFVGYRGFYTVTDADGKTVAYRPVLSYGEWWNDNTYIFRPCDIQGSTVNAKFVAEDKVYTDFAPATGGSYTIGDTKVTQNTTINNINVGDWATNAGRAQNLMTWTATPDAYYRFVGWWDDTDGKYLTTYDVNGNALPQNTATVQRLLTETYGHTVYPVFELEGTIMTQKFQPVEGCTYTIKSEAGTYTVSDSPVNVTYLNGETLIIELKSVVAGYEFTGWSNGKTSNSISVVGGTDVKPTVKETLVAITVTGSPYGSYTIHQGSTLIATVAKGAGAQTLRLNPSALYTFAFTADSNAIFLRWNNGSAEYMNSASFQDYMTAGMSIMPEAVPNTYACFKANGKTFGYLDQAIAAAQSSMDKLITVVHSGSVMHSKGEKSFTIPSGVTLLVPQRDSATVNANDTSDFPSCSVSRSNDAHSAVPAVIGQDVYCKLTVPANTTINVQGIMAVGGAVSGNGMIIRKDAEGKTYTHAEVELLDGATINVGALATLSVCGFMYGEGVVNVAERGTVYVPFTVNDFRGGNYVVPAGSKIAESTKAGAQSMAASANPHLTFPSGESAVFPFNRYSMLAIQCKQVVEYGARVYGCADLYAGSQHNTCVIGVIVPDTTSYTSGLIRMSSNATVVITYSTNSIVDNVGRTKLELNGTVTFGKLVLSLAEFTTKIDSSNVIFAIPYNYDIVVNGTLNVPVPVKLLPGATLTVNQGATMNVSSTLVIYDAFHDYAVAGVTSSNDTAVINVAPYNSKVTGYTAIGLYKSYPTTAQLQSAGLSGSAQLIVNGTLNLNNGTKIGGIIQTGGSTGKIVVASSGVTLKTKTQEGLVGYFYMPVSGDINFEYSMAGATVRELTAQIVGTDGRLINIQAGKTYNAAGGESKYTLTSYQYDLYYATKWDGSKNNNECKTVTENINLAMAGSWVCTSHSYNSGSVTTQPTCTTEGVKTFTCSECGATKTEKIAATGHKYTSATVNFSGDGKTYTVTVTCSACTTTTTGHTKTSGTLNSTETGSTAGDCKTPSTKTYKAQGTFEGVSYDKSTTISGANGAHTPGAAATCTAPQKCTVCNAELAPITNHTYDASTSACSVCHRSMVRIPLANYEIKGGSIDSQDGRVEETHTGTTQHVYVPIPHGATQIMYMTHCTQNTWGLVFLEDTTYLSGHSSKEAKHWATLSIPESATVAGMTYPHGKVETYVYFAWDHAHVDTATEDHKCDVCGYVMSTCSDVTTDKDHKCDVCGKDNVTQHVYGEVTYSGDGKTSYVASRKCNCGDTQTATATISSSVTTPATCTATGVKTYVADFAETWATDETTTETIPMAEHSFTTKASGTVHTAGTCKDVAVYYVQCDNCSAVSDTVTVNGEKDPNNHAGGQTPVAEIPATCLAAGTTAGTKCSGCGTVLSGCDPIAKMDHADTDHDHICNNGCNDKLTECEFTERGTLKTEANCMTEAVYKGKCKICGVESDTAEVTGEKDATKHNWATTLTHDTDKHWYACLNGCDQKKDAVAHDYKWDFDGTQHWQACQTEGCNSTTEKENCSGGAATCTDQATCTVCSNKYGTVDKMNHTQTLTWTTQNATQHEQKYSCCGAVEVALENHEWDNGACSECGYECQHADEGKDHTCDNGCGVYQGTHVDANKDHNCDYGCSVKDFAEHADKEGDKAHTCEYCGKDASDCVDNDNDYYCDICEQNICNHTMTPVERVEPTCEGTGKEAHYKCKICGRLYKDEQGTELVSESALVIPAKNHAWSVTITWAEDGKTCTATRVCGNDATHNQTATAQISEGVVKTPATCIAKGWTTYTATFTEDWAQSAQTAENLRTKDVEDIEINENAHDYDDGVVTTNPKCTEKGEKTYTCKHNSEHKKTEEIDAKGHNQTPVEIPQKDESCAEDGYKAHWYCSDCACYFSDAALTHKIDNIDTWKTGEGKIAATGEHNYEAGEYVWGEDNKSCTVVGDCSGCDAKLTAIATVQGESSKAPTCAEMGKTTYTATFTENWATTQTKEVADVPKAEHTYVDTYSWTTEGTATMTVTLTCQSCAEGVEGHVLTATDNDVASETVPGNCTTKSKVIYTGTVELNGKTYTNTHEEEGETDETVHDYTDVGYTNTEIWTECTRCHAKQEGTIVTRTYTVTVVDYLGRETTLENLKYNDTIVLKHSTSNVFDLVGNGWLVGETVVSAENVWAAFGEIDENAKLTITEVVTATLKPGMLQMAIDYTGADSSKAMTVDLFISVDSLEEIHKPVVMLGNQTVTLEKIHDAINMWYATVTLTSKQITQGGENVKITVDYPGVKLNGEAPDKVIDSVLIAYEKALEKQLGDGNIDASKQDAAINAMLNYGKMVQVYFGQTDPNVWDFAGFTETEIQGMADSTKLPNSSSVEDENSGITFTWIGANVRFDEEYSLRYEIELILPQGVTAENAKATLTVRDKEGKVLGNPYTNLNVEPKEGSENRYYVTYPVPASDIAKEGTTVEMTITFSGGKEIASSKFEYGMHAYLTYSIHRFTDGGVKVSVKDGEDADAKTAQYVQMLASLLKLGESMLAMESTPSAQQ